MPPDSKIKVESTEKSKSDPGILSRQKLEPRMRQQMNLYNEMGKYFSKHNAQLIGISVDSKWSHLALRGQ